MGRFRSLVIVGLVVAACSGAPASTPSPSGQPTASATAEPTVTAAPTLEPTLSPSPEPPPTDLPTASPGGPIIPVPPAMSAPVQISSSYFPDLRVATDDAGAAHVLATTEEIGRGLFHLSNASGVWTEEEITAPRAEGGDNAIVVASDTDGTIWVGFSRFEVWNPCPFECEPPESRLDGLYVINNASGAWSEPERLPGGITPAFDFEVRNGELYIAYELRQGEDPPQIAYATNAGGTWAQEIVGPGFWPDIELGLGGDPRIVYVTETPSTYEVTLALRGDTWSLYPVPDSAGDPTAPHLAVTAANATMVTYTVLDPARGYVSWRRTAESGWTDPEELAPEGLDEIAMGPGDALHYIYALAESEDGSDGLWWGWMGGASAVNRLLDPSMRDAVDAPSAPQSIALDTSGFPHIVYGTPYDEGREGVWYVYGSEPGLPV